MMRVDDEAGQTAGFAWCANVWCGLDYRESDGWGGLCPSCLTLLDEHVAGTHRRDVGSCPSCREAQTGGHRHSGAA